MNVSSYVYGRSFYHHFDVRPKLAFTLLFSIVTFMMSSPEGMAAVLLLPLILMLIAAGAKETWRCYLHILPLVIILLLFIPLQERDGVPLLIVHGITVMTEEGLWTVMRIISRLCGVSGILMLLLITERNEDIIRGLRAFHLPYNAAIAVSMILRFIPYLASLFSEIRDSMSLRLEEGKRGYPVLPSITSLVVASIRMIPETAAALEERGFGRRKLQYEPFEKPQSYSLQWLLGAIIPLSLLFVR